MEPLFCFAIVNWNTRELLAQCLHSILEHAGDFPIQILVADNASQDGSQQMVREKFPQVVLVANNANLGFAAGHEALFKLSRGTYHVLVNSDVRFFAGCLERWAAVMAADTSIGILGCRIVGPDGALQPSCRRFPSLMLQLIEASGINRFFPHSPRINAYKMGGFKHDVDCEVDQVMGSLFLIRRQLIETIGYLDTAFFMYYEEVDYCKRARTAGYKVFFDAHSQVYHEGGGSSKKVKVATMRRTMRSMRHYFRKHHGTWTWLPLLGILSLDMVTHFLHALLTRNQPLQTLKAYGLGWWDIFLRRAADQ